MYYHLTGLQNLTRQELILAFETIPTSVTSLSLHGNHLGLKLGADLAWVCSAIPHSVNTLDLRWNILGSQWGARLATALAKIPGSVTSLDLSYNRLDLLSVDALNQLSNTLLGIRTISLSQSVLEAMSPEQRSALKTLFPNVEHIIILDQNTKPLGGNDLLARHSFAKQFGLTTAGVPKLTLYATSAFFLSAKTDPQFQSKVEAIPAELKDYFKVFNCNSLPF